ncbi:efflux RND transporter periplasmic adaptor subunit [Thermus caldilimi]|uniref:efflux RND transporter periplasmic adaptor subunit n=1 Tax=Thermus caldilimi TaxID=2483360 RepID=UPI0010762DFB|nr:TolC family protein [Thermus caldilimi]
MARSAILILLVLALGILVGRITAPGTAAGPAQGTPRGPSTPGLTPNPAFPAQGRPGGFAARGAPGSGQPLPVQLALVEAGTLEATRQVGGTVVPAVQANVPAQVGGAVVRVLKNPGDTVAQGEAVVQLDTQALQLALANARAALRAAEINLATQTRTTLEARSRLEAQVRSAQAALQAAQQNYQATQRVKALGGASDTELAQAQAALAQAQANLEAAQSALADNLRAEQETLAALRVAVEQARNQVAQAELNLQNATLRAPFAGSLLAVSATPGAYLAPGATAFVLAQGLRVQFGVPPEEVHLLPVGSEVRFTLGAQTYLLKVEQNPGGTASGGLVLLLARPPEGVHLPLNTVGLVSYTVALARGPLIPVNALQSDGSQLFVYQVEEGVARRQAVQVLAQAGDRVAVAGLAAGTQVVVNPPPGLLDGTPVVGAASPSPQTREGSSAPPRRPGSRPQPGGR